MDFINVYAQSAPHGHLGIHLTEEEAGRFADALVHIELGEQTFSFETYASDGEAYTIFIAIAPEDPEALALPYTDPDYQSQPAPIPNGSPSIHDELLALRGLPESLRSMLRERKAKGLATYGTPLQRGNGRDPIMDCAEEVADAIAYAQQADNNALREALIAIWEDYLD